MIQLNISISSDDARFEEVVSALRAPRNQGIDMVSQNEFLHRAQNTMNAVHDGMEVFNKRLSELERHFSEILAEGDPPEGPYAAAYSEAAQDATDPVPTTRRRR